MKTIKWNLSNTQKKTSELILLQKHALQETILSLLMSKPKESEF